MNVFSCANYIAWILTLIIAVSLLADFVKTEASDRKEQSDRRAPIWKTIRK